MINWLAEVIPAVAADVGTTFSHTWPFLVISISTSTSKLVGGKGSTVTVTA